jgi:hypothetical protein
MKKIFRKYPDVILAVLALFFLGVLFFSFSWGIGQVVLEVNRGLNASGAAGAAKGFDLAGARALDLRGLVK